MWKRLFQGHILGRGSDYFNRDLVENVSAKDNLVEATVCGTKDYQVEIEIDNENIIDINCTCPHADSGNNCKHMAAVLFYLEDQGDGLTKRHLEKNVERLVEEADPTLVKEFLITLLQSDERLLLRFKSKLPGEISPIDTRAYKHKIDDIFWKYAGYRDFIDYESAWEFSSELEEYLNHEIQTMINNNQLQEAFELTNHIFIQVGEQNMDDSGGEIALLANTCLKRWREILENTGIELKRKMYSWFTHKLDGSVIDYMEEYIETIIFDQFKENEFLKEKIIFLDQKIEKYKSKREDSWFYKNQLGPLLKQRVKIMEDMGVDQQTITDYCKENLAYDEVRKHYINICINRKDYDQAIKLLEEGKDEAKEWRGNSLDYSLNLKELYKKTGKDQLYKKELWALVLNHGVGDLELYKELQSLYTDEEWMKKRETIFSKLSTSRGIDQIYRLEGLHDRLMEQVVNSHGLYMLKKHEEILKDKYSKELLDKYEETLQDMAVITSDRKRYREMVFILRRMKNYSEGKRRVTKIVNEWKTAYKNRPAMMDELRKL